MVALSRNVFIVNGNHKVAYEQSHRKTYRTERAPFSGVASIDGAFRMNDEGWTDQMTNIERHVEHRA
jgi:hypothetical protein